MSHPLSNSMLPATGLAPASANAAGNPAASARGPDDGFARALEARMGADARAAQRNERGTAPERQAERPPARSRESAPDTDERAAAARRAQHENTHAAPQRATPAPTDTPSETPTGNAAATAGAADAKSAGKSRAALAEPTALPGPTADDAADEAHAAPAEPAPAALAAGLPIVAAQGAPIAGAQSPLTGDGALAGEAVLPDDAAPTAEAGVPGDAPGRTGTSTLEQLLGEAFRHGTQAGKPTQEHGAPFGVPADRAAKGDPARATPFAAATAASSAAVSPVADPSAPLAAASATGSGAEHAAGGAQLAPEGVAAGLATTGFTTAPRAEQAHMPQLPVPTPAGHKAWAEDVGNRVTWMVGRHDAKAELVLTPPHLGKLEVSIQVTGGETTAHFVAASAAARDALEQAMPRLREILQQAGIQLGQANVSTSGEQQARENAPRHPGRGPRGFGADIDPLAGTAGAAPASGWLRAGNGMVDTFA
jgi:flagellar hook-length control protein FliK